MPHSARPARPAAAATPAPLAPAPADPVLPALTWTEAPRDHGGDMDRAMAQFGGSFAEWLDLSTGINRMPYPLPPLPERVWRDLPTRADMAGLTETAARYFATKAPVVALAGAQSAIQLLPALRVPGVMRILAPSYNEYAAVFRAAGWQVEEVADLAGLAGADLAVVVHPNNPDGRRWTPEALLLLRAQTGLLVVDESFMDMTPEKSLAPLAGQEGLLVLRSFGKFFGLAGLRLGFVLGDAALCTRLAAAAGPWPVAGPAIAIAQAAMQDRDWIAANRHQLAEGRRHLQAAAPWPVLGGCDLFVLFDTRDAAHAQQVLAGHRIWTRRFPWSPRALRLGIPAPEERARLAAALADPALVAGA